MTNKTKNSNNDSMWDYETLGDPEMTGRYNKITKLWGFYTLRDGYIKEFESRTREELEEKLAKRGLHMAKKMYNHHLLKGILGETYISVYEYYVYCDVL